MLDTMATVSRPVGAVLGTDASGNSASRIAELDGIRALAIWLVLMVHLFGADSFVGPLPFLPGWLKLLVQHGWLGVDLFFVLSGYLITTILLGTKGSPAGTYFRAFYARRALRILPLYVVVLAVLWIANGNAAAPYIVACLFFAANVATLVNLPTPPGAGPFWSLAVEEQFYLVWPWFVRWFDRRTLTWVAIAILVAEPFVRLFSSGNLLLTWNRADGLAMGALAALWFDGTSVPSRRRSGRLAATLLGAALALLGIDFLLTSLRAEPGGALFRISEAVLAFGALVILGIAYARTPATAPLRLRFARNTADLSYSLYLVHVPLLAAYAWLIERLPLNLAAAQSPEGWLTRALVVLAASYTVAACTRRFVEIPFLRMRRKQAGADLSIAPA